jgi:alpha-ribazole phosphatase
MRTYRIYLIRHGMTEANVNGRYVGITDVPLCTEGKSELKKLASEYEYPAVGKVYSSPLTRCLQTAEILYPDFHPEIVEQLQEYHFGIYENKSVEELKGDPGFLNWLSTNMAQAPEGGENMMEFGNRIKQGIHQVVLDMMKHKVSDAAVVTHGGVIMSILAMCGIPSRTAAQWAVDNGRGYSVLVNASLWSSSQMFEICDHLPYGMEDVSDQRLYHFINVDLKEDK